MLWMWQGFPTIVMAPDYARSKTALLLLSKIYITIFAKLLECGGTLGNLLAAKEAGYNLKSTMTHLTMEETE